MALGRSEFRNLDKVAMGSILEHADTTHRERLPDGITLLGFGELKATFSVRHVNGNVRSCRYPSLNMRRSWQ